MEKYIVGHTVDSSGNRYIAEEGIIDLKTDSLHEAIKLAEKLTGTGKCGYVERVSDGAVLGLNGTWISSQ